VIRLEIPDKVVLQRMQKAPAAQRKSVEQRLKDYHREMDMVQVYFPGAHVVHVDGTKNVKSVEGEVARILQERYGPNGGRR
jgi:adenylate kinase family enzyme